MKEIIKRTLIVAWISVAVILVFLIVEEPDAWYVAAMLAAFVLAVQFIGFGFINPAKLLRKL